MDAAITALGRNPLRTLYAQLAALSLPIAVVYALKALGVSMTLALCDGVLPVGDIMTIASGIGVVIVLAVYWNGIAPKWDSIVTAFQTAFASVAATVNSAFDTLLAQVEDRLVFYPSITIQGKSVTVNAVEYHCTTLAKYQGNTKIGMYYPAVLVDGNVFIDLTHPLETKVAKLFAVPNLWNLGIWATSASYARGLCGGTAAIWHNAHDSSEGYFPHYHHRTYQNFHCWYFG